MRRHRWFLAAVAALVLFTAACGDDDDDDDAAGTTNTTEASTTTTEADTTTSTGGDAASGGTLAVAETSLGEVLVDGEGMTLYLFTNDSGGASNCSGGCAETWPPLTVEGEPAGGEGVDAAKLGTIDRDDGSTQVTYNGHPLYLYQADAAPGDVSGQGVGGVWYAVTPAGEQAG
jgi:predicted lipoprotein with Yx(FWY)xxD motif